MRIWRADTYDDIMEYHCPLTASGVRSVTTTSVKTMIPPPPTPWMVLPTRRTVKFPARPPMREPAPNSKMLQYII
jgi:hypothetical protein